MEIRVPKGSKAVSVKDLSGFGGKNSAAGSENEVLINRGAKYKVVDVIQDPPKRVKNRAGFTVKVTPPPRIIVELEEI